MVPAALMEPAPPPPPPTPPDRSSSPTRPVLSVVRPLVMLLVLVAGALWLRHVPLLHHMLDSTAMARRGVSGHVVFLLGATLWCAFGLPRQVAGFAAGLAYGPWIGLAAITLASTLGCLGGFFWARWGGRAWALARLGSRFARIDTVLTQRPFLSILTLRLLPVGSALLLNLLGGLSGIGVWPFVAATVLGALPQNLIAVLLGSGVRVGAGWQFGAGAALFALSAGVGLWLWRYSRVASANR
ncbi:VTT domain-containing protein [Acetobacter sp. TBRC 12305]|uniref:TVP38/TMEM64 family membrane protein n=1 Tax=Acetobacter garciniae TaxID=2817435 RepID=A0A939HHN0_9PROT|nr:VTT domain-containing protein [Acetobacter garciniae]MBO1324575.1 VTT domain-containing protein [Acetobacter garciniae]MBX0344264.1 VTT domain-containing protein [Acetobacter garciniae]